MTSDMSNLFEVVERAASSQWFDALTYSGLHI